VMAVQRPPDAVPAPASDEQSPASEA